MDCGATCLKIVLKSYGKSISIHRIRSLCQTTKDGVNLLGISQAAEKLGMRSYGIKIAIEQLIQADLPCIIHWKQNHFVVLYKIKNNKFYISDPTASSLMVYERGEFTDNWYSTEDIKEGVILLLTPTPDFQNIEEEDSGNDLVLSWNNIASYFLSYKRLFIQLFAGIILGIILQMLMPFLTQSIVDMGIKSGDLGFIHLILISQLMVFIGATIISFIRSWILLHINTRVSISMLSDLLNKIMKLPMSYFELKTHGDFQQRMEDQHRIENFLTGNAINTIFSFISMIFFSVLLAFYNTEIFFAFLGFTGLYIFWVCIFLKRRRLLDNKRFDISTEQQTYTVEMLQKIQDIKFTNSERQKRWKWEAIQAKLFKFKVLSLSLSQYQSGGSMAINQVKYIIITYMSAKGVIDGEITLGTMMAIQYIVGTLSNPVEQTIGFLQGYQDAKISIERLNEIFSIEDEESSKHDFIQEIPTDTTISLKDITFRYIGAGNKPIFSNINITFKKGETTAIVGASGSGKTTILKLLLRYYDYEQGEIYVGGKNLKQISFKSWRESCGIVMQDSHIFADTIVSNIAVGEDHPDEKKLNEAIKISNLYDFIDKQPFGLKTKIGGTGNGLSQGQKQRLLLARAVYKQPHFLFLDEATNALDAKNEKIIIENLNHFFENRTVIVVAHRLSTVKNADNIIVLNEGKIVEQGNHNELISLAGVYYDLVRNQLELGN